MNEREISGTHLIGWRCYYSDEKNKEGQIRGRQIRRSALDMLLLKCPGDIQAKAPSR